MVIIIIAIRLRINLIKVKDEKSVKSNDLSEGIYGLNEVDKDIKRKNSFLCTLKLEYENGKFIQVWISKQKLSI